MKKLIKSLGEMETFAEGIKTSLALGDKATVLGLYGDLGAGKTAFVKALAKAFGIKEHITSPTFVIMKKFSPHDPRFSHLFHIDAYRLEKGEELERLGWQELIADPKNLICIEWPEKVREVMPEHKALRFTFVDEEVREVEY